MPPSGGCAEWRVTSVLPQAKPWRRRNSLPPSISITEGWSAAVRRGTQKERHDKCRVFLFGGGGGSRTRVRKHFNRTFSGRRRLLRRALSLLFPFRTASRHAGRSGELHDVWHGQSLPYSHLPLNDALPGSRSFQVGRLPLISQQQQQCCCSLIYNCPF